MLDVCWTFARSCKHPISDEKRIIGVYAWCAIQIDTFTFLTFKIWDLAATILIIFLSSYNINFFNKNLRLDGAWVPLFTPLNNNTAIGALTHCHSSSDRNYSTVILTAVQRAKPVNNLVSKYTYQLAVTC